MFPTYLGIQNGGFRMAKKDKKAFAKPKTKLGEKLSPEKTISQGQYSFFSSSPKSSENGNGKIASGDNTFFKRSYDTEKEGERRWLMS